MSKVSAPTILALTALTGFYVFAFVVTIKFDASKSDKFSTDIADEMNNGDRNERSTPRSFILPRTPAVALEQERRRSLSRPGEDQDSCVGKLLEFADGFTTFDSTFDVKAIETILAFQKRHGLNSTGRLDAATRSVLEC